MNLERGLQIAQHKRLTAKSSRPVAEARQTMNKHETQVPPVLPVVVVVVVVVVVIDVIVVTAAAAH